MQTILDELHGRDLELNPYPYVYKRDVIADRLCSELIRRFPPLELAAGHQRGKNNFRFNISSWRILENPGLVDPLWYEFIQAHANQDFLNRFMEIFGEAIAESYPQLGTTSSELRSLKAGIRNIDTFSTCDVLLDIQIAGNTPVKTPSSTRDCHVDDPRKLFAGLFYLRQPDDRSTGGQLQVWEPRRKDRFTYHNGVYVSKRHRKLTREVPYERNALMLFLNTPLSWHGVAVRNKTPFPRIFVNVIGEVKEPLFDVKRHRDRWDHFLQKHGLRKYHEETPYFL